jgi:heme/copper-type cytochrome/quinol oxidase subunit 4
MAGVYTALPFNYRMVVGDVVVPEARMGMILQRAAIQLFVQLLIQGTETG